MYTIFKSIGIKKGKCLSPHELKIYFRQKTHTKAVAKNQSRPAKTQPVNNFSTLQHVIYIVIKFSIVLSDGIQISYLGKRNKKYNSFALE